MGEISASTSAGKSALVHRAIQTAAARYARKMDRKRVPVPFDDLRQESWRLSLEAAPRCDPSHPGLAWWFYTVISRGMGPIIAQWSSDLSMSRLVARGGMDVKVRAGVLRVQRHRPLPDGLPDPNDPDSHPTARPDPERMCIQGQLAVQLRELRRRLAWMRWSITSTLPRRVRRVGELLEAQDQRSDDGPARGSRKKAARAGYGSYGRTAKKLRITTREVTRAAVAYQTALKKSADLAQLRDRIAALEKEIQS